MSYWEIEDYLAQQEQVEFSFRQDSEGMSFIDPSKDLSDVVPADQPLNAPLWMVQTIFSYFSLKSEDGDQDLVRVQMPKYLHSKDLLHTMNQLGEDSRVNEEAADLRQKSPYIYEIFASLINITRGETSKVSIDKICNFLNKRGNLILSRVSSHTGNETSEHILSKYTESEVELYQKAKQQNTSQNAWKYKTHNKRKN